MTRRLATRSWAAGVIAVALGLAATGADAGEVLSQVQARRLLRCGVSDGRRGFSHQRDDGRWVGLDVDFCRAVAAAVVGDPERVRFFPLVPAARFVALRSKEIDLLARNTTWTLRREAGLGVHFVGTLFLDGQAFMVPRTGRTPQLGALRGARICVVEKTTTQDNLADYFAAHGWPYQPVLARSTADATRAFFAGECQAYTADAAALAAVRLMAPGGGQGYVILPERISKEPLGPVINRGDEDWFTLLRWVLFALIEAEERGITQENVVSRATEASDPALAKFLDAKGVSARLLRVPAGWVVRMLQAVGNYGEMFERNLGGGSELKLERGVNRLWNRGGVMYSPPLQ